MYTPDNWVIFKIDNGEHPVFYKVLAGWSGGYLDGDSWRMNSGIVKIEEDGDFWLVYGQTGSCYKLHKEANQIRMNISHIYSELKESGMAVEVCIDEVVL